MSSKVPIGVDFFDQHYGGVYSSRGVLVCGHSGSGKTVLSLQFIAQGLEQGQRCLMLSAHPSRDLAIFAQALGFKRIATAIGDGSLTFLEYSDYVPGREITLPPEGFQQLQQVITDNDIQRLVLDTILPWVCIPSQEHLVEHIFSFVRAFERMNTTTLFTIPKPASPNAMRLRRQIEDIVPISITLTAETAPARRTWVVNKFLGAEQIETTFEFIIQPDKGIILKPATPEKPPAPAVNNATPERAPSYTPTANVISERAPSFAPTANATFERAPAPAPKQANPSAGMFSNVMLRDRNVRREQRNSRPSDEDGKYSSFSL